MTRLALQIPNFTYPDVPEEELFERVATVAGVAERSGFDTIFVMDHFFQLPVLGPPELEMFESYTLLAALAARTESARLGTLVTGVTYRNPALLAKVVTALDVISGGRALLGIGAAWFELEHDALGVRFPPLRERYEHLEDALRICRAMFTQRQSTVSGTHHSVTNAWNSPAPLTPGGPPILVGGSGEKRTLRIVARYADMCNIHGSPATIRRRLDILRGHCEEVGRDYGDITTSRRGSLIVTATAEEAEQLTDMLRGVAGPEFDEQFTVGTEDQVLEQVGALVDTGLDCLIFDMAYAPPEQVRQIGSALVSSFG